MVWCMLHFVRRWYVGRLLLRRRGLARVGSLRIHPPLRATRSQAEKDKIFLTLMDKLIFLHYGVNSMWQLRKVSLFLRKS